MNINQLVATPAKQQRTARLRTISAIHHVVENVKNSVPKSRKTVLTRNTLISLIGAVNMAVLIAIAFLLLSSNPAFASEDLVKRGQYIVEITGCNDCHTPGYAEQGGQVPKSEWLKGNPVGFKGPWGITFPVNLRLLINSMSEDEWVVKAQTFKARPPMPWFNVRFMKEKDQRAVYRFIKSLGPAGEPAPGYIPPGKLTKNRFIQFVPTTFKQ